LLEPLRERIEALARAERYEEAADARDRAAALAGALHRQRRLDGLRRSGRVVVEIPTRAGGVGTELHDGRLVGAPGPTRLPIGEWAETERGAPLPRRLADELACVARWLDSNAARVRLVHCDHGLASPLPRLPTFTPTEGAAIRR